MHKILVDSNHQEFAILEFFIDLDNTKANIGEILSGGVREHASTENDKS